MRAGVSLSLTIPCPAQILVLCPREQLPQPFSSLSFSKQLVLQVQLGAEHLLGYVCSPDSLETAEASKVPLKALNLPREAG